MSGLKNTDASAPYPYGDEHDTVRVQCIPASRGTLSTWHEAMPRTSELKARFPATTNENVAASAVGAKTPSTEQSAASASMNNGGGSPASNVDTTEVAGACHTRQPARWSFGLAVLTGVMFLLALTLLLTSREEHSQVVVKKRSPHIVFILADDLVSMSLSS
ncbi:hypothetical protein V5799_013988 [Amblyomma americanum]|uniref:Uncharacterized protein n=1 Tax=Amblyomma americanum TaxID=6943 RepID=A0AAQ4E4C3_AMBAM